MLDKDGVDYVEWDEIGPFDVELFAYTTRQAAEGAVQWRRSGLQVAERQIDLDIKDT